MGEGGSNPALSNQAMAISYGIGAVGSIGSAYSQYAAYEAQGAYQRSMAATNEKLAQIKSEDALKRGRNEVANYRATIREAVSKTRASAAAQGIQVDTGSSAEIQNDIEYQGEKNVITIHNNAWRESWGYQVEGLNAKYTGVFNSLASDFQAGTSLLTGSLEAVRSGLVAGSYAKSGSKAPSNFSGYNSGPNRMSQNRSQSGRAQ